MRNKYKPFFYEEKKTSFKKVLLYLLITAALLIFAGFQVPRVRQIIAQPIFAAGSFIFNAAKELFASTRMYHEPASTPQAYTPMDLPDRQVLFAESLENLAVISQEDPLADLRQTPTPSEYSRVAVWEYLDPNLNYEISSGETHQTDDIEIQLVPPVFERADLFNDSPALLSALLRYWGFVENQYHIAAEIHPDALDPAVNFDEMAHYIETFYPEELQVLTRINGDRSILISLLQNEIPILVRIQSFSPYYYWLHDDRFEGKNLLILGYGSLTDTFFYQDTVTGNNLSIPADELLSAWYPFQRTYLITYPVDKDDAVREALSENYYETLNIQKAAAKFKIDSENLPNDPFAQYNYGATLHASDDDGGAWEYFQKALEASLPQRYLNYQIEILETALSLGYADDLDLLVDTPLSRNSHDDVLNIYKGWAAILRGEIRQAEKYFEKGRKINPNSDLVLYALKYKETMIQ